MKSIVLRINVLVICALLTTSISFAQEFEGKAYYFSKASFELGSFGARLSEAQKKQVMENLKNRLEKTYVLHFNKTESSFEEEVQLDAISGATDSWGKNFTPGRQFKNVQENLLVQNQEFYGKQFLVKDKLPAFDWIMTTETKQIGKYMSFKATSRVPAKVLTWYDFSWDELRSNENNEDTKEDFIDIEAWYTIQIPVSHGPAEFWGLPGLILEIRTGNTVMLCSEIILNTKEKNKIEAPTKGKVVSKMEYKDIELKLHYNT